MSDTQKIASLIKDIRFAMLTHITAEGHLHATPMTTQDREFDGSIWFIGDNTTELCKDLAARPQVNLAYSQSDSSTYVSITGTARLVNDPEQLDALWSEFYNAYFEQGKNDPKVQLIEITAHGAQYWEASGKVMQFAKMITAAVTGAKTQGNERHTVSL